MQKITDKLYTWASVLDPNALEQQKAISRLDIVQPHVAGMPDTHYGLGAPVGTVIPTVRSLIPSAVGVDIGCVDAETEYLSPAGWRRISDYDGGRVMQYDPALGVGTFVQPQRYISRPQDSFLHIKTKYGVNQMLTSDHRVLVWRIKGRNRRRVMEVVSAADLAAEHSRLKLGAKAEFETTFTPWITSKMDLSDDQIRVQVMVNADAYMDQGGSARLHLSKERKIERARVLLDAAGITWSERAEAGTTTIRFTPPRPVKGYRDFWVASQPQLAVVADECLHWDGNLHDRCFYTRDRESADFIQYAFTATGHRSVMRSDTHYRDGRTDYRVFAHDNHLTGIMGSPKTPITEVTSPGARAYCFTVPSGFWVMRRGGNIVMTGNCGMVAARTQWEKRDLTGIDLNHLHHLISAAIPSSAGRYNGRLRNNKDFRRRLTVLDELGGASDANEVAPNWPYQLGSLGSGNHFIEISLDELNRAWIFLHSGSRGVGNKLAMRHIKIARELCRKHGVKLENPDLAYLTEGQEEFWEYLVDLRWAQQFALLNRDEMADRVIGCLAEVMGEDVYPQEWVRCHHNYTEKMEGGPDGNVWLSRKGAIDASRYKLGLIPGSMGAASYIVSGLGNEMSFSSAPHGAGRVLSRKKAKVTFSMEDLSEKMQGIAWGHSSEFLDEHPGAYKPITQVIKDSDDLVVVEHTLRQIVNVKGV